MSCRWFQTKCRNKSAIIIVIVVIGRRNTENVNNTLRSTGGLIIKGRKLSERSYKNTTLCVYNNQMLMVSRIYFWIIIVFVVIHILYTVPSGDVRTNNCVFISGYFCSLNTTFHLRPKSSILLLFTVMLIRSVMLEFAVDKPFNFNL